MGHGAVKQKPLRWIVRIIIIGTILYELVSMAGSEDNSPFAQNVLICMCVANSILLFIHGRKIFSALLTWLDGIASLRFITVPMSFRGGTVAKEVTSAGQTPAAKDHSPHSPVDAQAETKGDAQKDSSVEAQAETKGDAQKDSSVGAQAETKGDAQKDAPSESKDEAQKDSPGDAQTESKDDSPRDSSGDSQKESQGESQSAATTKDSQASSESSTPNKKPTMLQGLVAKTMFIPTSYPHMVGLFVYVVALGTMLQAVSPASIDFPSIPIPLPVSLQQLFSYNGLGLVMLSFCGVGIFVSRDWKEAFKRLGWEKPKLAHVGIGLGLVVFSFCYDLVWSLVTHAAPGQDMATKLSGYNSGTFASGADLSASIILALATAICAGVGEETLTRGALQPALGIVPAAILHGVLHAQFSHAPILIIQIAIWSIVFGIVRRFTNTTTTIIGHAGFNFVTTFLFAFNP